MTLNPHRRRGLFCLVLLCGAATVAPRATAAEPILNEMCPVMTLEKADPKVTTVYRGKKVAFCCERCLAKFQADPQKYVGHLPQFTMSAASGDVAVYEHESADEHLHESNDEGASATHSEQRHDHASEVTDEGRAPLLGRLHPALVHFPLAGIPLALLGFLAWVMTGREAFAKADVPPLLVGTLGAIAAVITGYIAREAMRFGDALERIAERHQLVATTVMVLAIGMVVLRIGRWDRLHGLWRGLYGAGLLIACVLVGITGFLGGSLVFGPDHLSW